MESIKPLSEAVHSSMRSGFIISDLISVVEELVYNSIDAGSSKVLVSVGVGTGFVKVDDDGHGINRDGLVMLGERYATSKFCHLADGSSASSNFGCYGEVLCSISDVSLLEIITKAHGRPHGYRKIIKGCKCLYLGIDDDDDRQDTGTTVIVRDLFYNQPVRRRQMQSRPKRALHSIRKCILRIALVRSKVSFRVFDIESEDELLQTQATSSTISLLGSFFGVDVSSLHELSVCDGALKLEGYVSGPCDASSTKAIQYIYINSRFVCKGMIHKALNRLANSYWDEYNGDKIGKRCRSQACPSYCLNLTCPASYCDFSFELSRALVEFKEWGPVLLFIEKSVAPMWSRNASNGRTSKCTDDLLHESASPRKDESITSTENDWFGTYEVSGKRCKVQNKWKHNVPVTSILLGTDMQPKDDIRLFPSRGSTGAASNSHRKSMKFKETRTMTDSSIPMGLAELHKNSPSTLLSEASDYAGDYFCEANDELVSSQGAILQSNMSAIEGHNIFQDEAVVSSKWKDEYLEVSSANFARKYLAGSMKSDIDFGCKSNLQAGYGHLFLRSCSTHGNLYQKIFSGDGRSEFHGDLFRASETSSNPDRSIDTLLDNGLDKNVYTSPRMLWQDDVAVNWSTPENNTESIQYKGSYSTGHNSFLLSKDRLNTQYDSYHSVAEVGLLHSSCLPSNCYQCSDVSDSEADIRDWDLENIMSGEEVDAISLSAKHVKFSQSMNSSENLDFDDGDKFSDLKISSSSYSSSTSLNGHLGFGRETHTVSPHWCQLNDLSFMMHHNTLFEQKNDSSLGLCCRDQRYLQSMHHGFLASNVGRLDMEPLRCEVDAQDHCSRERYRRSYSAPPIYRGRRKFLSVIDYLAATETNNELKMDFGARNIEGCDFQHQKGWPLFPTKYHCAERHYTGNSSILGEEKGNILLNVMRSDFASKDDEFGCPQKDNGLCLAHVQKSRSPGIKWRHGCHQTEFESLDEFQVGGDTTMKHQHGNSVLDISSMTLHLAWETLVPKSIGRYFLEDAHVLLQLDKKFIPVVAGGTLAVIDQHAADERIRLEELHKKVLSGELKSVTYLEAEKELALPETAYQHLYNYSERIQDWGWICNIYSQGFHAFTRNLHLLNGQPARVTLRGVPCILGVNLSATDLLEYLEQLAGTDGSSTVPPSILRVLNYKACRGAIMFGDTMLHSECSLLVEELKKTSLCFQCAHGRPTTVPLIDLNALHKQISKLRSWNAGSEWSRPRLWRQKISLERAEQRLHLARRR